MTETHAMDNTSVWSPCMPEAATDLKTASRRTASRIETHRLARKPSATFSPPASEQHDESTGNDGGVHAQVLDSLAALEDQDMHSQHDETGKEGDPAAAKALARSDRRGRHGLPGSRMVSRGWRGWVVVHTADGRGRDLAARWRSAVRACHRRRLRRR